VKCLNTSSGWLTGLTHTITLYSVIKSGGITRTVTPSVQPNLLHRGFLDQIRKNHDNRNTAKITPKKSWKRPRKSSLH